MSIFCFKQKTAYEMRISDWSSDVCSSDLRAAADNLVPVTLELGGKSPTFVGRSANKDLVGQRVALGKMMNAGQICLAPDYLLVPEDQEGAVIDSVTKGAAALYPTLLANDDYTRSEEHTSELQSLMSISYAVI